MADKLEEKNPITASFSQPTGKEGAVPNYTELEKKQIEFLDTRIQDELFKSRKKVGKLGLDVEKVWHKADRSYQPHRLNGKNKKVLMEADPAENKGMRGSRFVQLGSDNWQSDRSQPNLYAKVQTALSILVDSNPEAVFKAMLSKFKANDAIAKNLYNQSWTNPKGMSKGQLKLFIFNLAKYGWAIGQTVPLRVARPVKDLTEIDKNGKKKYELREHVEYDGVYRENLNPNHAWIDDMALPENPMSRRDWAYYKKLSIERLLTDFPKEQYPYTEYVSLSSTKREAPNPSDDENSPERQDVDTCDTFIYENKELDWLAVKANGIWIVTREPLPTLHKELSCWDALWSYRDETTPYGIGIFEAMEQDLELKDLVRNMTIDQLVIALYKFWLYSGTNQQKGTGEMLIRPGVGHQVADVKDIIFPDFQPPTQQSYGFMDMIDKDMEESTAITKPLSGEVIGKTAFESAQVKEASLRRLRLPLESIASALEKDAYLTVSLNEMIYSIPEVIRITDPKLMEQYMKEIQGDPELYAQYTDEEGQMIMEARLPKEMPMNIDTDKNGKLIESEKERFFRIKPSGLHWEGIIQIKPQSIIRQSKELDKQMNLELFNLTMPIIQGYMTAKASGQDQLYVSTVYKPLTNIIREYDQEPNNWIPDEWNDIMEAMSQPAQPEPSAEITAPSAAPLFVKSGVVSAANGQTPPPDEGSMGVGGGGPLETVSGQALPNGGKESIVQRVLGAINPFK